MNRTARLLCSSLLLLLAACATARNAMTPKETALESYGTAIRWSEFSEAMQYLDPELATQQALSDLELERLKLIQITGYEVKSSTDAPDGSLRQVVEIRVVNKNTQRERVITDRQSWRWDSANKRYWLTTGLPDFNAQ